MSSILPDTPQFETPVYGTVFAERAAVVAPAARRAIS